MKAFFNGGSHPDTMVRKTHMITTPDLREIAIDYVPKTGDFVSNPWLPRKVGGAYENEGELRLKAGDEHKPSQEVGIEEANKLIQMMPVKWVILDTGGGQNVKHGRRDRNSVPCVKCGEVDHVRSTGQWRARKFWIGAGGYGMIIFRVYKCDGG